MIFALEQRTFEALQTAYRSPNQPTAAERLAFIESRSGEGKPRVSSGTAEIDVVGVLTKTPDIISMLFGSGNTTYEQVGQALDAAEHDPNVHDVVLNIDSPGGQVDGLFQLLDRIGAFSKPIRARAANAMSAAYAIAAAAGSIEATHASGQFGSIGVATAMFINDRVVHIASTDAPKKRPDVRTEEGQATVREHLDDIHAMFVEVIAKGRRTNTSTVNTNFGRGGVLLAAEAKNRGMIDSIRSAPTKHATRASARKEHTMRYLISDLRASNPNLHAELTAICGDDAPAIWDQICAEAAAEERARCVQHIGAAVQAGDIGLARRAVESGAPFDEEAAEGYMQIGFNRPRFHELPSGGDLRGQVVSLVQNRLGNRSTPSAPPRARSATPVLGDVVDETADAMDRLFGVVAADPSTSPLALDPNDPLDTVADAMDRLFGEVD